MQHGAMYCMSQHLRAPEFCHVVCALAINGVTISNLDRMEPVVVSSEVRARFGKMVRCC